MDPAVVAYRRVVAMVVEEDTMDSLNPHKLSHKRTHRDCIDLLGS